MIPRQVAEEIKQPLPLFIKWDDCEYGLRAKKAGYPTVTLPGAAIWHMAWSDKDDAIDWQAYFHLRNRLVVAALHMPGNGRGLVVNTVKATLKHLLCLEYSTVAIQNKAIADFLAGPEHVANMLPTALGEVHAQRKEFSDAVVLPSSTELPLPSGADVGDVSLPLTTVAKVTRVLRAAVHNVKPAKAEHLERPQLNVPTIDARWFLLAGGRRHRHHRRRPRSRLPQAQSQAGTRTAQGSHPVAPRTRRQVPRTEEAVPGCRSFTDQHGKVGTCLRYLLKYGFWPEFSPPSGRCREQ